MESLVGSNFIGSAGVGFIGSEAAIGIGGKCETDAGFPLLAGRVKPTEHLRQLAVTQQGLAVVNSHLARFA
jgi:hypothetical protein